MRLFEKVANLKHSMSSTKCRRSMPLKSIPGVSDDQVWLYTIALHLIVPMTRDT